jgi:AcrR family transcriptional regulator
MEDVAKALGVAKGTLYLYVESKEALFDLVIRHADGPVTEPDFPVRSPRPGDTLAALSIRLRDNGRFDRLEQALACAKPGRDELVSVIEEVFDVLAVNRCTIRVVNASARDLPALAKLWYDQARTPLLERLERYVKLGIEAAVFVPQPDPTTAARMIVETSMWFAVHRAWDFKPDGLDDRAVRRTVVDGLVRAVAG